MKLQDINPKDITLLKEKYQSEYPKVLDKIIKEDYPIQYLIGNVDFYNINVLVNESVLIPRYETEFLVEKTIKRIKDLKLSNPKILELGIGSGCISIALKKNISCLIKGVDISNEAVLTAKKNASKNNVDVDFTTKDMLEEDYENYDIIISNPPYVSLSCPVGKSTAFEPQNAIFAPDEGMYFYQEILKKISMLNIKPKLIAFEIGYDEALKIELLNEKYLKYDCDIEKDLAGKDRYAFLTKIE